MISNIVQWIVNHFRKTVNSIAFYPALIALGFLGLSYLMIHVDFSDTGKQIKSQLSWLKLKDASTARTIVSVIAAGILSLTVFSFSMVMIILNQAASQMSNRVLDKLIGNRYQQFVLGFYIGTIVYSLFLLSAIRDIDSGIHVPSLSTYLLIVFAIVDIFLFTYFLHYVTQSVKYGVIIRRIYRQTQKSMETSCCLSAEPEQTVLKEGQPHFAARDGIFEGFNKAALLNLARQHNIAVSFLYPAGNYVLKGTALLSIHPVAKSIPGEVTGAIDLALYINPEESIDNNFYYGFRQLAEVAIKALSPGINDPGTAIESLRALASLLSFRLGHFTDNCIRDEGGTMRIITKEHSLEDILRLCIRPIWDYGRKDRFVQNELQHLLLLLLQKKDNAAIGKLLAEVRKQMATTIETY